MIVRYRPFFPFSFFKGYKDDNGDNLHYGKWMMDGRKDGFRLVLGSRRCLQYSIACEDNDILVFLVFLVFSSSSTTATISFTSTSACRSASALGISSAVYFHKPIIPHNRQIEH